MTTKARAPINASSSEQLSAKFTGTNLDSSSGETKAKYER